MLELLLVLAILVATAAIAIPMAVGPLEGARLRKAADQVRASFNRARVAAMRTGQIHFFRFQPGTNLYAVEALNDGESLVEGSLETMQRLELSMGAGAGGMNQLVPSNTQVGGTGVDSQTGLPKASEIAENTFFVSVANLTTLRSARVLEQMIQTGATQLSEPILFYPDGTSSTTQLVLTNTKQQFVVIRLRGLTGLTQVSDLLTPEEVPQ